MAKVLYRCVSEASRQVSCCRRKKGEENGVCHETPTGKDCEFARQLGGHAGEVLGRDDENESR